MTLQKNPGLLRPCRMAKSWAGMVACCALWAIGGAWAQAPAPGELRDRALQQELLQQQRDDALQRARQAPDVRLDTGAQSQAGPDLLPADEQPCFKIHRIELTGEGRDQFAWALAHADRSPTGLPDAPVGRCLGAEGVRVVMTRIQNAIIARGYVTTRVLAAPQNLNEGVLSLSVLPGRVRQVRSGVVSDEYRATWWNALPVQPGDLLNLRDIEQGLENFKRLSSVAVDIQITASAAPDAQPGDSDLVINWQQGLPVSVSVSIDDAGSRDTGVYQGNVTLFYDHAFTLHDQVVFSHQHDLGGGRDGDRGSASQSVQYSVPWGYWMFGLSGGSSRYHQTVFGQVADFRYSGEGRTGDVRLGRVLYRDGIHKLTATLKGWSRSSSNRVNDVEQVTQRRKTGGWELALQHRAVWGGTILDLGLQHRRGTGAFNAQPAASAPRVKIIAADAQLNHSFELAGVRLRHQASMRAQWNRGPLASQDRFGIGSRYTVRGFDGESQLTGERGWLVRQDLAWAPMSGRQEVYAGLDHGQVGGERAGAATEAGRSLTGAALGYRGAWQRVGFDVFMAWPLNAPRGLATSGSIAGFSLHSSF